MGAGQGLGHREAPRDSLAGGLIRPKGKEVFIWTIIIERGIPASHGVMARYNLTFTHLVVGLGLTRGPWECYMCGPP